jgi:hypothetical protein
VTVTGPAGVVTWQGRVVAAWRLSGVLHAALGRRGGRRWRGLGVAVSRRVTRAVSGRRGCWWWLSRPCRVEGAWRVGVLRDVAGSWRAVLGRRGRGWAVEVLRAVLGRRGGLAVAGCWGRGEWACNVEGEREKKKITRT